LPEAALTAQHEPGAYEAVSTAFHTGEALMQLVYDAGVIRRP
jgi:hypothetical protein